MKTSQQVKKTILKTELNTFKKKRARESDEKMLTYGITNWIEPQKKRKWRHKPYELQRKAKKDGPGKRPSGTQDSTNLQRPKGEHQDQPKDGKTN